MADIESLMNQLLHSTDMFANQEEDDTGNAKQAIRDVFKELQDRVDYAMAFGLIIGVAKSSDCPEGKLAHTASEGSELDRLYGGIADLIVAEKERDDARQWHDDHCAMGCSPPWEKEVTGGEEESGQEKEG